MNLRTRIASTVGAIALAGAVAYAPAASADRVGFNVTFGGPGYAFNIGNTGYGYYDSWRPAPVYVAPYTTYYQPHYYAPVVRPYPVYRHHDRHYGHRHGHRHDGHRGGHDRGRHGDRHVGYVHHR